MSTVAEWEAWEAEDWAKTQTWLDRVRVLGYTAWACDQVPKAEAELQKAVAAMERARKRAEKAIAHRDAVLDHAERMAHVATAGDAGWFAEVASCLETLVEK